MKIKIILILSFFFFFNTAYWLWGGTSTEIINDTNYQKLEGRHTLFLKQKTRINPFAWKSITKQFTNWNFSWYFIDWILFNWRHSLWAFKNADKSPNQDVLSWVSKRKVYRYDTTDPTCQQVELYEDWDLSKSVELWNWTNKNIMARIACMDLGSWCKSGHSEWLNVWYKTVPQTTFIDWAWNSTTCMWNMAGKMILFDEVKPKIEDLFVDTNEFSLIDGEDDIDVLASNKNTNFSFRISDTFNSSNWVSGLKNYKFDIKYIEDHKWNSTNIDICNKEELYSIYNPLVNWKVKEIIDTNDINVICDEILSNWIYKINKIWRYEINVEINDFAWNIKKVTKYLNVYPDDVSSIESEISVDSNWGKFANALDKYTYTLELKDQFKNPVYNKEIISNTQEWKIVKFDSSIDNSNNALIMNNATWNTDIDWKKTFTIWSYSPWIFSENFTIRMNKWNNSYVDNSLIDSVSIWDTENYFNKLLIWEIDIPEVSLWDSLIVWSWYTLVTNVTEKNTIDSSNVDLIDLDIIGFNNWYVANNKNCWSDYCDFTLNFWGTSVISNDEVLILSQSPYVSYRLWWKRIKYRLSPEIDWNTNNDLTYDTNSKFLWVKILWSYQWQWKQEITWQKNNFSDISKLWLRTSIRKNTYNYIKNMSNWDILNNVKYIYWDTTIWWNISDYETLVVENWNITINWWLSKSIWIINLSDNFNITDLNSKWNIIINWNSKIINAYIYSDWWIVSDSNSYEQLRINWALFTRNTIWGSIWVDGSFILPWWKVTGNHELSKKYDLNHIRMWNNWWDINWNDAEDNWEVENASLIIRYNNSAQSNPPKLFWN